jgi:hypothetical protein
MTTDSGHDDATRASEEVDDDVEIYEGEPDFEESPTAQPSTNEEVPDA